ncbi:LamG-like jellyroll fold domain-containing protein [Caballeronia sp. LjRoot31]|jgi:hypothetical protein|uniref:LamG-like jellyroll fold domain-containing protein n=1 Tax=Caballeronia sp. LjRoot31 TaxID=3342324 RepID=UPI003ECFF94F
MSKKPASTSVVSAENIIPDVRDIANQSRRSFVRMSVLLPTLGATSILAACGGSSDSASVTPVANTPAPTPPVAPKPVSSFGLAVLPDTQFYSRYATAETGNQFKKLYGSEPFMAQTQWLADNAKALKIPFVIHVGDIVDQVDKPQQWAIADTAMKVLEKNRLPYSVIAGNHDVRDDIGYEESAGNGAGTDATRDLADEPYLKWFDTKRAKQQATFGGRDPSGFHEYHIFEAEGQRFLVLGLSWRVSDNGIAWARDVLQSHPTLPAILVNHQLIAIANDAVSPQEVDYGLMLWEKLIKSNDQIFMTVNGHHHGSAHLTKINEFGNPVEEMVVDYQMAYQGGNGLMRYYEFDFTNNEIKALSFSPWVRQKPAETLNSFDQAMLTEANHQFTIKVDFAKRFSGFAPKFKTAEATNTSLTAIATSLIMDGFKGIPVAPEVPAKNAEDYPKVAETLAHWRFFGGTVGSAVADGTVINDASGRNNALKRGALIGNGSAGQLADMKWSDDRHRLSSAPGSVQFLNTDGARFSYFMTDVAAAINKETFRDGYTVEMFIKLDKSWTAARNQWMNIMTRGGRRGDFPAWEGGWEVSPPVQCAISNLKEVQWEITTTEKGDGAGPMFASTNWSGEILLDAWMHVAIVNDPAAKQTTMYIEGAPVLRNAVDAVGLATFDLPWAVGAGLGNDGNLSGGFLGAMGEIRITPKPLPPAKWLTARA